jgi:hypothetical protein
VGIRTEGGLAASEGLKIVGHKREPIVHIANENELSGLRTSVDEALADRGRWAFAARGG